MRCDVVRFVAFEDLGVWEAELVAHGFEVRYLDVGVDDVTEARHDAEPSDAAPPGPAPDERALITFSPTSHLGAG